VNQPETSSKKIPRTVWALGFVSLLMDMSSEMIHGLLPAFLVSVLGASHSTVGLIEGFGEAMSLVVKVFSGPLSDHFRRRRPFVLAGYAIGALSKPFFALAGTPALVFGARVFDRLGKGIRGAPRDALVADVTPPEVLGKAFGLRHALDTVGAFVGPFLAIVLMHALNGNFRLVFWIATIPGLLCVALILYAVQDPEHEISGRERIRPAEMFRGFKISFWFVIAAGAIFQLARFSEAFLVLRAQDLGLSVSLLPAVLIAMNIVFAGSAYPIGMISDRMSREWLLVGGALTLVAADLFLGMGKNLAHAFVGIGLWGLHLGLTQGILAALVADASPPDRRGTAYGLFNLASAAALLLASVLAGILWDQKGAELTYLASGALALTGALLLLLGRRSWTVRLSPRSRQSP
jgi:MFS family permease